MINEVISAVKKQIPKFNDDLIVDLRKREIANLTEFIAERYRECCIVADANLELIGYHVLPPGERLIYELTENSKKKKNNISIRSDEAVLTIYTFRYCDQTFTVPLYIPYIYEDSCLIVGNTHYECMLNVTEKLFSIRTGSNGVTIKVIRSPISFYKNYLHTFADEVTNEQFVGSIVACKIHSKKTPKTKKTKPTVIHYLLCKFSLQEVMLRFNLDPNAVIFVEKEPFEEGYHYFKIKNTVTDQIFLKVRKDAMLESKLFYDIVSTIVYILSSFRFITYKELINNSQTVFRIILGKLIHSVNTNSIHALSYMARHIESVDTYLDNYTKDLFKAEGITITDIYDLLCFIQINISKIIIDYPNNNMYNKRVEAINNVIIDGLVRNLNLNIYKFERKDDFSYMLKSLTRAFSIHPRSVLKNLGSSESVRFSSSGIYGDNWLLNIGDKVLKRLSATTKPPSAGKEGSKVHSSGINAHVNKFHPSMLVVESAIGFSSKPGSNCLVNPYVMIDNTGGFIRPSSATEIDDIYKYLTNDQKGIVDDIEDDEHTVKELTNE